MSHQKDNVYPDCATTIRVVQVGGLSKSQLIEKMRQQSIFVNDLGETLLMNESFTTADQVYRLVTVELTVRDLGLSAGATLDQIFHTANLLGLQLCPLELGPHLRLTYLDQPEGFLDKPSRIQQAPYGSITIASEINCEDEDFPKGFYLRKINGELWLRGYLADFKHVWEPDDRFIFCQSSHS